MKKLVLTLLLGILLVSNAFAVNIYREEIMDTTFNAVTTTDTSDTEAIQGFEKVAFIIKYNETEVGNSISAAITCDISYDGTNWITGMSFLDIAGGSTYQTSETLSGDGWYYFWLSKDVCIPYIRVNVTATNTDADDLLVVNAYIIAKE